MDEPASYPANPNLVFYPAPVLRQRAEPVRVFDQALRDFCRRMFAVMEDEHGVGLAAPQVGVSRRIFVTDHARRKDGESPQPRVWINPVIEAPTGTTVYEEGCLSFPAIYAKVTRHDRFTIRWQDEHGEPHVEQLDVGAGQFLGIVVQHELDHLDGIVFVDHLSLLQLGLARRRLKDLEAAYRKQTGKAGSPLRR
ncbi:MAG TPA: peptide deformylase [Planctomycetes bacterium]|nr:peptide deformylase [Planctomycetota bacterium]